MMRRRSPRTTSVDFEALRALAQPWPAARDAARRPASRRLEEYLKLRRTMGFKLREAARQIPRFGQFAFPSVKAGLAARRSRPVRSVVGLDRHARPRATCSTDTVWPGYRAPRLRYGIGKHHCSRALSNARQARRIRQRHGSPRPLLWSSRAYLHAPRASHTSHTGSVDRLVAPVRT